MPKREWAFYEDCMIVNEKKQTELTTKDFYYDLPEELIAQEPIEPRDASRLLVLHRENGSREHRHFYDILDYLREGDTLVINDSKVIPARLHGIREGTGAVIEVVLLRQRALDEWEVLTRPGKKAKVGTVLSFGEGLMTAEVIDIVEEGNRILRFDYDKSKGDIYSYLDKLGKMPLPPYITAPLKDRDRYQTVYANERGSAAAPTAGLHFTPELLDKIRAKGVDIVPVMLHVGLGTFRPVKVDNINDHVMHTEYFSVTEDAAARINATHARGGRVIAVGTTSCRVLESASTPDGVVHAMQDDTGIFIYPGYTFKAVDCLITNFHLPESTLLMLVSAFSSREMIMETYAEAIRERYRFFSFGDAMFLC